MPDDRPVSPLTTLIEPVLPLPPSALTADDWARIYGEEFAEWMELTPEQRWEESRKLWATYVALGGRLGGDDAPLPPGFTLRRLGV